MGVKDLWQLLAPTGRRVSVETLEGKTLAIDASIWITQFLKAMRDESGKVMKNAHLIGTLRRILKLLFHHIKPVFVFDGATPTLKIQTVRNRRKIRERQEVNLKKAAEKILMARLKEHAIDMKKKRMRKNGESRTETGFNPPPTSGNDSDLEKEKQNVNVTKQNNESESLLFAELPEKMDPIFKPECSLDSDAEGSDVWEPGYSNLKGKELSTLSDDENSENSEDSERYDIPELFTDSSTPSGVDLNALSSLPANMRKTMIEQARAKERKRKRANYIPVASNPSLYSLTQVSNFLRVSKLNKVISDTQEMSQKMEKGSYMGGSANKIAADGSRRYVLFENDESNKKDTQDISSIVQRNEHSRIERQNRHLIADGSDSEVNDVEPGFVEGGGFCVDEEDPLFVSQHEMLPKVDSKKAEIVEKTKDAEAALPSPFEEEILKSNEKNIFDKSEEVVDANYLHCEYDEVESDVEWESASDGNTEAPAPTNQSTINESKINTFNDLQTNFFHDSVSHKSDIVGKEVKPFPETANHNISKMNIEMMTRAVASAAGMGDWAGRAVQRVLSKHAVADSSEPKSSWEEPKKHSLDSSDYHLSIIDAYSEEVDKNEDEKPNANDSNVAVGRHSDHSEPVDMIASRGNNVASDESVGILENMSSIPVEALTSDINHDEKGYEDYNERESDIALHRAMRDTEGLTSEMVEEVKHLLDVFRLPWITAPFEAEAQCAYLEQIGLVQGVVTEDSDVFLFGGECIYKNMFDERKYVEVYLAEDVRRELGISRSELICLAYLLGSDYTEGVRGVGIVNAMEVLSAFGGQQSGSTFDETESHSVPHAGLQSLGGGFISNESGSICHDASDADEWKNHAKSKYMLNEVMHTLEGFKRWLNQGEDFTKMLKDLKQSKKSCGEHSDVEDDQNGSSKLAEFEVKHKRARSRWVVQQNFPSEEVAKAYISPMVNKSTSSFEFSSPELFNIQDYCKDILGWTEEEFRGNVLPVMKKWLPYLSGTIKGSISQQQRRIDSYYHTYHDNSRFAKVHSDRLRNAIDSKKSGCSNSKKAVHS